MIVSALQRIRFSLSLAPCMYYTLINRSLQWIGLMVCVYSAPAAAEAASKVSAGCGAYFAAEVGQV